MIEKQARSVDAKVQFPADIGHVIRNARVSKGMTQSGLAAQVGVSRKWVSEVENGKSTAEVGLVLKVLRKLNLDLTVSERPPLEFDIDQFLSSLKIERTVVTRSSE